jgi:hypothetical protein
MNRVVIPARQGTQPGGIGSLESIIGLLKSLKIRARVPCVNAVMTVGSDICHISNA